MSKILTVVGARPQFVKAAVVSRSLAAANLSEILVHTGQHFDANMSKIFFDEMAIPDPQYHLQIGGGSHGQNTGRMIEALERVMKDERPDYVMVFGDTDSTLAAAISASKLNIPIAHVEAGLRSYNRRMPEEINRVLTDHVSEMLFAPSDAASQSLSKEGIDPAKTHVVGDVMFDAVEAFRSIAEKKSDAVGRLNLSSKGYVLATLHRAENTDDAARLRSILEGLATSKLPVILPLHPRTRSRLAEFEIAVPSAIQLIEPAGYLDMLMLEANAALIATDSGGVQKEAYFLGVPCVTMRDETEWTELIEMGVNRLVGASSALIAEALVAPASSIVRSELYGDGTASIKIAKLLLGVM